MNAGKADHAITVLIAPEYYAQRASMVQMFQAFLSYEALDRWLGGDSLIRSAIERCRNGWVAEEVPTVSGNFAVYVDLVRRDFPQLRVKTN